MGAEQSEQFPRVDQSAESVEPSPGEPKDLTLAPDAVAVPDTMPVSPADRIRHTDGALDADDISDRYWGLTAKSIRRLAKGVASDRSFIHDVPAVDRPRGDGRRTTHYRGTELVRIKELAAKRSIEVAAELAALLSKQAKQGKSNKE